MLVAIAPFSKEIAHHPSEILITGKSENLAHLGNNSCLSPKVPQMKRLKKLIVTAPTAVALSSISPKAQSVEAAMKGFI